MVDLLAVRGNGSDTAVDNRRNTDVAFTINR